MAVSPRTVRGFVAMASALAVVAGLASTAIVAPASAAPSSVKIPSASTPRAASVPGAPTNVRATQWGNANVTLAWDSPASNGGSALTDFVGATLAGTQLVNAYMTYINARTATFTNVNLASTQLSDATLTGVVSSGLYGTPYSLPTGWSIAAGAFRAPV